MALFLTHGWFAVFTSTAQASCLVDEPKQIGQYKYPEQLPGQLYDADTQCKWQFGSKAKLCGLDFVKVRFPLYTLSMFLRCYHRKFYINTDNLSVSGFTHTDEPSENCRLYHLRFLLALWRFIPVSSSLLCLLGPQLSCFGSLPLLLCSKKS